VGRKHIHKFKKTDIGRKNGPNDRKKFIVFKCVLPDCTYYIEASLAEGKFCICNRCGNLMILTKAAMKLAKTHCPDCTERKVILPDLSEMLKDKGIE
jgi:ssDNA-binding Zn-finger/Zn-ribbon topoisomerase 1